MPREIINTIVMEWKDGRKRIIKRRAGGGTNPQAALVSEDGGKSWVEESDCGCGKGSSNGVAPKKTGFVERMARGMVGLGKAAMGIDKAPRRVVEFRLSVCQACPHHDDGKCGACGCWLGAKTKIAGEACPIGSWGPHLVPGDGDGKGKDKRQSEGGGDTLVGGGE
jgi:hypothetical protein